MIFPLTFAYGMNPAQGPDLVFNVLPRVFVEMPAGRAVGTVFFALLVLAALMPSIALLEPTVAWVVQRWGFSRARAVMVIGGSAWVLGLGSVLSFNKWEHWYPLSFVPLLANKTFFDLMDYVSANIMLPIGALLTSVLVGWRLSAAVMTEELAQAPTLARCACRWLLRYACPLAIVAVFIATLL
jgi:NSS family neurotransmitter:Na+ symporter